MRVRRRADDLDVEAAIEAAGAEANDPHPAVVIWVLLALLGGALAQHGAVEVLRHEAWEVAARRRSSVAPQVLSEVAGQAGLCASNGSQWQEQPQSTERRALLPQSADDLDQQRLPHPIPTVCDKDINVG